MTETPKLKLIEVALPLEAINRAAGAEKSKKIGKPQQIHHWWARRPITSARALLFAQLVDDPSSHPEAFPTPESQRKERERLHGIASRLVQWEAAWDEELLAEAYREILASTGGAPPVVVDPFAGGGSIPLEANRLGLRVSASDLNPVAVLINKALIEIPSRFDGSKPVHPDNSTTLVSPQGTQGLVADIDRYGEWVLRQVKHRVGHLYSAPPGVEHVDSVISWVWARTVSCPNPACKIDMPLVRSWRLSAKKGHEVYVHPLVVGDASHPSGLTVDYSIEDHAPPGEDGTVGRTGAHCIACETSVPLKYVREEGSQKRLGQQMLAVVEGGNRRRIFHAPDETYVNLAAPLSENITTPPLPDRAPSFSVQAYGMTSWRDLFTDRQLVAIQTFTDVVRDLHERVVVDAQGAGLERGDPFRLGGTGAVAYADAIITYLTLTVSRLADWSNTLCRWESKALVSQQLFGQQSVAMVWDFSEANVLGERSSGSFNACLSTLKRALEKLRPGPGAEVAQAAAQDVNYTNAVVNTDPPYYANIGYSDLSDFFYIWQRRCLHNVYPELYSTVLVPKSPELVANPYRHGGPTGARQFFEDGFSDVFSKVGAEGHADFPIAVYYAFKQSDPGGDGAGAGWQTLLEGMVATGWQITSTWPIRTEMSSRKIGQNANALASSILLTLRRRRADATVADRRQFLDALRSDLPETLRKLQQGEIAPVDLPQAAIGPGMAIYSRYTSVLEPDGSRMSVRAALERINEILDQVLEEQEVDFDSTTRFAIAWYRQHGYGTGRYGDADNLARARNTAVDALERYGILTSRAGNVTLLRPSDLVEGYDVVDDPAVSTWEVLHHLLRALEDRGIDGAGRFLAEALSRPSGEVEGDLIKELGHLLFRVAEKQGWTKDAIAFNSVVTSWPDIASAAEIRPGATQSTFAFDEED